MQEMTYEEIVKKFILEPLTPNSPLIKAMPEKLQNLLSTEPRNLETINYLKGYGFNPLVALETDPMGGIRLIARWTLDTRTYNKLMMLGSLVEWYEGSKYVDMSPLELVEVIGDFSEPLVNAMSETPISTPAENPKVEEKSSPNPTTVSPSVES